jgi:hypothetical protein
MRRGGATLGELADLAAIGARLARGLPVGAAEAARCYRAHAAVFRRHGLRKAAVVRHGIRRPPAAQG